MILALAMKSGDSRSDQGPVVQKTEVTVNNKLKSNTFLSRFLKLPLDHPYVINRSNSILSPDEISVLARGLTCFQRAGKAALKTILLRSRSLLPRTLCILILHMCIPRCTYITHQTVSHSCSL